MNATSLNRAATTLVTDARRLPLVVVSAVLQILGSLLAWTTFSGYPGQLKANFFLGGVRVYTLLLTAGLLLHLVGWVGRRSAGIALMLGNAGATVAACLFIVDERGGLGALAVGPVLVLVGALLGAATFASLAREGEPAPWRRRGFTLEAALVAGSLIGLLALVVYALDIEDKVNNEDRPGRFVAFVIMAIAIALAANKLGWLEGLRGVYRRQQPLVLAGAALTAAAFPFTQDGNAYWIRVAAYVGVFSAAAIGLNIVVGLAGLLDLGYIAFFGVGAYVAGLLGDAGLTTSSISLPFGLVMIIAACAAALLGVIIGAPTLRLRGDYLAIVTLGFGEIFRLVANNLDEVTRGPNGIAQIPNLKVFGFDFGAPHDVAGITLPYFANYYFLELVLIAFVILVFRRLNDSRIGRGWVAIREDETAAEAMGINTVGLKLLAFAIGAFLAGLAGSVNAHVATQVSPDSYQFLDSVLLLAAVVLGGMGTVPGAILGAAVLIVLPEKLRAFQDYRLMIFGVALILLMRFRPEGIIASSRRKRELHDHDPSEGDALGAPVQSPVAR